MGTAVTEGRKANTEVSAPKTIREFLVGEEFRTAVAQALPKHLNPDRFLRIALTAITKTPKLRECEHSSFFSALLSLSQLGLEPDGRRAHLIPFENRKRQVVECQLIVDYKGLVELAFRSGQISFLHADIVCENDLFVYDRGQVSQHTINLKGDRGKPYAAYAICRFKDGGEKHEVMSRTDIEAVRRRSRAANAGPWVTDEGEMWKKTVFRRMSKWLPLSADIREAVEKDDDQFDLQASSNESTSLADLLSASAQEPKQIENQTEEGEQQ